MRLVFLSVALVVSLGIGGCGGCGDDPRPRLPDAALSADAAVDAAIDAGLRPVTLTITKNRAPVPGVRVYFLNADNSLVKSTDTDAAGKASAIMVAGGSVTAIDPFPPDPDPGVREVVVGDNDLRTFAGVKPGDELVLTRNEPQRINVTVTIPSDPLASNYDISTTCGSGSLSTGGGSGAVGPSGTIALRDCGATTDILVVALDDETGRPRSAVHRANVALTDGSTLDLSAETFQALSDVQFNFTNVPVGSLQFTHVLVSARGPFGVPFGAFLDLESGNGTATLKEPVIAGTTGIVGVSLTTGSRNHIADWVAVSPTYSLDMTGVLLPTIDFSSYDATIAKLTWGEGADGAAPDLTIAGISVFATSERTWRWVIAAPYRRGELTFPTLPNDVASWAPGPDDNVNPDRQINVKVTGGYDAVRNRVLDLRDAFNEDDRAVGGFLSGPPGRVLAVEPVSSDVRRRR